MLATVVPETTGGILFAATIQRRSMRVDGRTVRSAARSFEAEMYVYYGTNEYNFEKLPNPPEFEPTRCASCGKVIKLGEAGYSVLGKKYTCMDCLSPEVRELLARR